MADFVRENTILFHFGNTPPPDAIGTHRWLISLGVDVSDLATCDFLFHTKQIAIQFKAEDIFNAFALKLCDDGNFASYGGDNGIPAVRIKAFPANSLRRSVMIRFVPGGMNLEEVRNALATYGKVVDISREIYDREGALKGVATERVKATMLITGNIPSFITVQSLKLNVNYHGQRKTCSKCESISHQVKDCPIGGKKSWGAKAVRKEPPTAVAVDAAFPTLRGSLPPPALNPNWMTIIGGKPVSIEGATANDSLNQGEDQATSGQPEAAPPKQASPLADISRKDDDHSDMDGVETPVGDSVTRKRKKSASGKTSKAAASKKLNRDLAGQQKSLDKEAKKGTTQQSPEKSGVPLEVTVNIEREESEIPPIPATVSGEEEVERCSSPINEVQDEVERLERASRSTSTSPASGQRGRSDLKAPLEKVEKSRPRGVGAYLKAKATSHRLSKSVSLKVDRQMQDAGVRLEQLQLRQDSN